MAALTKDRNTKQRAPGTELSDPVAAGAVLHYGAQYQLNATGFAVPATATVANKIRGVVMEAVNNTGGADGAVRVKGRKGIFNMANSTGADELTRADIETVPFVVDDQTVGKTNGGSTRPATGKVVDIDSQGVWIDYR